MAAIMDDLTKKLIVQYDDPMPGQRNNAFEMTCDHFANTGQTWRDGVVQAVEQADALKADNARLNGEVTQYKNAIRQWQKFAAYDVWLTAQLAVTWPVAWGRTTGKRIAACLALPVIALVGWQSYERSWSWPAVVDDGLHRVAASATWQDSCAQPSVHIVAGKPYWALLCGETETDTHLTAQGVAVGMHCVHLYAHPAEADFGQYIKRDPYALWGLWRSWPERAVDCRSFPLKEAEK
jgi:hypothetical protein